jgi:hypothetical protein
LASAIGCARRTDAHLATSGSVDLKKLGHLARDKNAKSNMPERRLWSNLSALPANHGVIAHIELATLIFG